MGPVTPSASQKRCANSSALFPNSPSRGASLQPPLSPPSTPQGDITVSSWEGDSSPARGGNPKGVSWAISELKIHPYVLVIPTGSTCSRKHSQDVPESPLTQLRVGSDFVKLTMSPNYVDLIMIFVFFNLTPYGCKVVNAIIEQHKSDLLKAS